MKSRQRREGEMQMNEYLAGINKIGVSEGGGMANDPKFIHSFIHGEFFFFFFVRPAISHCRFVSHNELFSLLCLSGDYTHLCIV